MTKEYCCMHADLSAEVARLEGDVAMFEEALRTRRAKLEDARKMLAQWEAALVDEFLHPERYAGPKLGPHYRKIARELLARGEADQPKPKAPRRRKRAA